MIVKLQTDHIGQNIIIYSALFFIFYSLCGIANLVYNSIKGRTWKMGVKNQMVKNEI